MKTITFKATTTKKTQKNKNRLKNQEKLYAQCTPKKTTHEIEIKKRGKKATTTKTNHTYKTKQKKDFPKKNQKKKTNETKTQS